MLLQADAKGLEWVVCNWFAQDRVGMQEIWDGVDQHALNQQAFGLPERKIAKIFVFRLIYGGGAWSYANDPDFNWISKRQKFWQHKIDAFYDKYRGISRQHAAWVGEVAQTGRLLMPTGRIYPFERTFQGGEMHWPRTKIVNYPVQGFGADIMSVARVSVKRRLDGLDPSVRSGFLLVSTVHDSIVVDIRGCEAECQFMATMLRDVFANLPRNLQSLFNIDFNLPLEVEIKIGNNLLDMTELL